MKQFRRLGLLSFLIVLIACGAGKIPHRIMADYDKQPPRLIAVLKIANASDPRAAEMLRTKLIEGLFFKGYPRIPDKVIDALEAQLVADGSVPSAQQIGEKLRVDAVLSVNLREAVPGKGFFYAATSVAADFELRSARTGEVLWSAKHGIVERSFRIIPKRVELRSAQLYEPAIQELVDRALETLPDAAGD
ncbi:MAG: hypothetical protein FWE89_00040 [Syntrophaceae bacterium]|nr:hypothetical protein [Syntrophaceae bacterium]